MIKLVEWVEWWKNDGKMILKFACVVINLGRQQNDYKDRFAKLSNLERLQSDNEDSFVRKLI